MIGLHGLAMIPGEQGEGLAQAPGLGWAEMNRKKFVPRLIILPQYLSLNAARR
jgi:hypothetical protein